jgi:hypothetical protein
LCTWLGASIGRSTSSAAAASCGPRRTSAAGARCASRPSGGTPGKNVVGFSAT